jgi:tetratricopeptide (TPR) repeat protein
MKKEYQQCYQLCLEWIQYNKTLKKPSKGGEVVEAGIRSCLKLHWFKEALELVECLHKDNSREPGIVFVRAKVYRLNGLYVKAIELYLEYLKIRNNDYLGWLELAKLFQPISIDWTCVLVDVAMELVNGSHRPDTIFSKLHKEKELGEMVLLCESPRPLELDSAVLKRIGLEQNQIDVFISLLSSNSSIKVQ